MAEKKAHFVGIGGIGMSGIARVLMQMGMDVSGSDAKESLLTRELHDRGAAISIGHAAANVHGAAEVVVSSAIRPDNIEVCEARRLGIPIVHRALKLAQLVNTHRGIAIAGTHGKTTTSSMAATVLSHAGLVPSYVVGGIIKTLSDNARAGQSEWFIIEADESDGSLVEFHPEIAIITNIELDHTDYYRSRSQLDDIFSRYISNIKPGGLCVYCADDPGARSLLETIGGCCECVSYGLNPGARLVARNIETNGLCGAFDVEFDDEHLGPAALNVPGEHNVANSLAVIAAALRVGLSFEQAVQGLAAFHGVERRFEIIGHNDQYIVVDDYAHHPSEIKATLCAARKQGRRIVSIFQPHRFSRTQSLATEFGAAFVNADEVVVTDIYSAGEDPIPHVSSDLIVQSLRDNHHPSVHFISGLDKVADYVANIVRPNDLVITLGAGDVWKVARTLSQRLIN
ncbi:MAG: UDP-N-acetylmuramate--L-alanine ligase [bacterium]